MVNTESMTERLDWAQIDGQLDVEGYVVLPGLLAAEDVHELAPSGNEADPLVWLADEHLGEGELRYLPRKLSPFLQELRETFYRRLAPAANRWAELVGERLVCPAELLSEPQKEFTGGELVMVEQRPRMQSRPIVLSLKRGDMAVIATAQRPHKGSKGYYRVNMKHGISRVRSRVRRGVEILFHDAAESRAS